MCNINIRKNISACLFSVCNTISLSCYEQVCLMRRSISRNIVSLNILVHDVINLLYYCNINHPKFPCRICAKNVHDKDKAVQCDLCKLWIHITCNNLNYLDYRHLQNCDESWYCIECCGKIFPFNSLSSNKNFLVCCTSTDKNI